MEYNPYDPEYEQPYYPEEYAVDWRMILLLILGSIVAMQGLSLLVANEKKQRTRTLVLQAATGNVKKHDPREPYEEMNFELVHCVGKVRNDQLITDHDFKISCEDSYRMTRTVEQYQWQEHRHERQRDTGRKDDEGRTIYETEVY